MEAFVIKRDVLLINCCIFDTYKNKNLKRSLRITIIHILVKNR